MLRHKARGLMCFHSRAYTSGVVKRVLLPPLHEVSQVETYLGAEK